MRAFRGVLGVFLVVFSASVLFAADRYGDRPPPAAAANKIVHSGTPSKYRQSRKSTQASASGARDFVDVAPVPGAVATGAVKTAIGAKMTYRTTKTVSQVGLFYLDVLPRDYSLVRSIAAPGGVFWFGEFKDAAGGKVFVTARAEKMNVDAGDKHRSTEFSILRIGNGGQ